MSAQPIKQNDSSIISRISRDRFFGKLSFRDIWREGVLRNESMTHLTLSLQPLFLLLYIYTLNNQAKGIRRWNENAISNLNFMDNVEALWITQSILFSENTRLLLGVLTTKRPEIFASILFRTTIRTHTSLEFSPAMTQSHQRNSFPSPGMILW